MSVKVSGLTKVYGTQRAVNNLSFEVKKGEVLGFLGPNGAGKSTTLKIVTCFLPPTEGKVTVCGHDTDTDSLAVRRSIGYLPEHNPVYKEMYVKEYLHFIASLHRLPTPRKRVAEMVERTGLTREQNKLIGALSKGYRQRVGLAQAMIHDPEVLILDEPTSGLDPNQLVEIRHLIQELGSEKTVILSTHIMQEVQALCCRVLILNKGELVADDTVSTLQQRVAGSTMVTVEFAPSNLTVQQLLKIKGVTEVKLLSPHRFQLISDLATDIRPEVFAFAVAQGFVLLELRREVFSMENVFQKLTAV